MYVIKFQQLFPEGDWMDWRGPDGAVVVYHDSDDAEKCAVALSAIPKNRGYRYKVFPQQCTDPDALAAAERRSFQV